MVKFQEFDWKLNPIHGANYLEKLKKHVCKNGFPGMLILAIDKETMKCNLHYVNNRLTVANEYTFPEFLNYAKTGVTHFCFKKASDSNTLSASLLIFKISHPLEKKKCIF